jgi:hypothetical protein
MMPVDKIKKKLNILPLQAAEGAPAGKRPTFLLKKPIIWLY